VGKGMSSSYIVFFEYILEPRNKWPTKNPVNRITSIPTTPNTINDFFILSPNIRYKDNIYIFLYGSIYIEPLIFSFKVLKK